MPSYIVSVRSDTRDGSTGVGDLDNPGSAGVVMVTATDEATAKAEGAQLLGTVPARVQAVPLDQAGY